MLAMQAPDRLDALLLRQQADSSFIRNVTAWHTLPGQRARSWPWPHALDSRLSQAGAALGIRDLYDHQAAAIEAVLRGENVTLSTGTASGKTLGYILPVLHTLLRDPKATALLLYPTKALAHDQIAALERWIGALNAPMALRPYDGDTPQRFRAAIRKEARIIVSNPDMVHLGMLPHHTQWMRFFQGLRYIVLDELHIYRGVFGSHVANVLRRLRRIAAFYGAAPQYVAASATIGNAQGLAESLLEMPVTAVEEDGAAYGKRHVIFYNPPLVNPTLGLRASAADEALALTTRLLQAEIQTIVFARSRLTVELFLREMRSRAHSLGYDAGAIQGYRGGYLPNERREIELGLRDGRVRTVVATNALELGIDIGALDASVLVGYPGTIAATRQQMGRAGRRAGTSLSVLIATAAPLDQYLVQHPEYFFGRSPEQAFVNPDALSLLASHLTCAAFELPFQADEGFGNAVPGRATVSELLAALSAEGVLHTGTGTLEPVYTWVGDTYPAQAISLRSATPDNVVIRAAESGVIGTLDRPSAARMVHEGAVYFHGAISYLIESLDWEQGIALARLADPGYYTVSSATTKVERLVLRRSMPDAVAVVPDGMNPLSSADSHAIAGGALSAVAGPPESAKQGVVRTDEEVLVRTKPAAYRRVHLGTGETLGWGEINLPEQQMETEAFRLTVEPALVEALAEEGVMVAPLDYGPEWSEIRKQMLERDGHRCRICGQPGLPERPLEVHHLTPLRSFMAQYARPMALKLAHTPENLVSLCGVCHKTVERARGAHTALSGLAYLLQHLAPVFLMCDPGDLGTCVEARDAETGQPAVILYDGIPGGVGLTPRLVDLWPGLVGAALERVRGCPCSTGCPSCVGPAGESEVGAKRAALRLLELLAG
jgi:DEAD/DEAH box helicase domain-containing protein